MCNINRVLLLVTAILLVASTMVGQTGPTITSFAPTSGQVGTTVSITGTSFDATPTNNVVYFGATKATVTGATSTSLTVTVPHGATYKPISVTTGGLTAYSASPFVVTFTPNWTGDALAFDAKVDFGIESNSGGVVVQDFDGDGKPDVAVSNTTANTISIFRNISTAGTMTAGSFAPKVDIAVGCVPGSPVAGDFDGDGKVDLAWLDPSTNAVAVLRNTSTLGTVSFAAGGSYPFWQGWIASYLTAGDVDGDGRCDLIGGGDGLMIKNNTGSMGSIAFAYGQFINVRVIGLALGDIDGDGKPDIIAGGADLTNAGWTPVLNVFRNLSMPGSFSFASPLALSRGGQAFDVVHLAVGDLDGDGKADMVGNGSLWRNTSTPGNITFESRVDFPGFDYPALTDLNGDGKLDVVSSNSSGSVSVYRNTSTPGVINTSSFAAKVDYAVGAGPTNVELADIDGDGVPDIVCSNSTGRSFSVLRNKYGETHLWITSFVPLSGPVGTSVTITGTNFSTTPTNNVVYFGATKGTVTGATSTSLTVTVPRGATYKPISVTVNGQIAYSAAPFVVTFTPNWTGDPLAFDAKVDFGIESNSGGVVVQDFDGDGKPDVAVSNTTANTISIFRNISTAGTMTAGSFAPKVDIAVGCVPVSMVAGDFDGDGKADLAWLVGSNARALAVLRNTSTPGTISFEAGSSYSFWQDWTASFLMVGDVDGDGRTDLVGGNQYGAGNDDIIIKRNTGSVGNIAFADGQYMSIRCFSPTLRDIDGDGKPDLVFAQGTNVSILRNLSTPGSFAFASSVDLAAVGGPQNIAVGDLDGDGKMDIVAGNCGGSSVLVWRNTSTPGSVTFDSRVAFPGYVWMSTNDYPVLSDLNGDGKLDIVVSNHSGAVGVYRNTSTPGVINTNSFAPKVDYAVGSVPTNVELADIDGDGVPDIVCSNSTGRSFSVLRNRYAENRLWITSFAPTSGPVGTVVTITGTNFDATLTNNVVYFGATKGTVTGATSTSLTVTVPRGATYKPISVTVNGQIAYSAAPFVVTFTPNWTGDPLAFDAKVDFGIESNSGGVVVQDFDGDGNPDVAVSNTTANTISIFRNISTAGTMTAGSFAAKVDIAVGCVPGSLVAGDFDGDGKVDLAWLVGSNAGTLAVLRNTSTPGTISFESGGSYSLAGLTLTILMAGDVDGDGRCDLVAGSNFNYGTNGILIKKNTSTVGNISFVDGPYIDASPFGLTLSDVDGDGKPEILSAQGNVSVFRNLSTPGSCAFASPVVLSAAGQVEHVAVGDVDGDGKPDIIGGGFNVVSVWRNTSTSGNITCESRIDYPGYLWFPGTNNYPALTDLNGDGKLDIVISSRTGNVGVYRNTSTPGVINTNSFAAKVDYTVGADPTNVELADIDGDGVPDIVCSNSTGRSFSVLRNKLVIGIPPAITLQPTDQTACASSSVNYAAAASGMPAPTVQWQASTDAGATWANIDGATSSPLSFTCVIADNGKKYRAVFTNLVGSATTNAATLTVIAPPAITAQPSGQTVCAGNPASFSAAATGTPTVQWQVSTDAGSTWVNVQGATTCPLSFTVGVSDNGKAYRAVFTTSCGSATTNAAMLTVNSSPSFTVQPTDQTAILGTDATFAVSVIGSPVPALQWQSSTDGGAHWVDIADSTRPSLIVRSTTLAMNGYKYKVSANNSCGNTYSNVASLSVITVPGIVNGTVRANGTGLVDVTVTLLDQNGNSLRDFPPTTTNNAGQYTFNAVPSPLPYQVIIVEPLGYGIVDPPGNPQPVTLSAGGTGTVDFTLTVAVISNNAQGLGYWKHQFDVYVTGRGSAQETQDQLNAYLLAVQHFYTPHFTLFQNLSTFSDWSGVLTGPNKASMRDKAKQHLATLVLNFASLKIGQYFIVTVDGRTAGDVLTYTSGSISNANTTNAQLETAKDLAEKVNNKQMIAAGLVPSGGGLLYKGTLESITWGFGIPSQFALSQNYPNPFNPVTTIRYELPQPAHVTLIVYDITGRQVAELVNETKEAGYYDARFDASNLASGMYLYRIQAGEFVVTKKLILLK